MAQWTFHKLTPCDKTREAMQGEFFATEAIRNPAEALVREAIQNSLDAGIKNETGHPVEAIRMRIGLFVGRHAVTNRASEEFFAGVWPHLSAEGNGLRNAPSASEPCP